MKCRTFAIGARGQAGFTLLELIVVLAIASVVLLVGAFAASAAYDSARYRSFVRMVLQDLRATRIEAMSTGQPRAYLVDRSQAVLGQGGRERKPPPGVTLDAVIARSELAGEGVGAIRFFPDGASTGGSILIQRESRSGVRLRVDWLLGKVSLETVDVL
jgi:general secretion pathway protein H